MSGESSREPSKSFPIPSPVVIRRIGDRFRASVRDFADLNKIEVVRFGKGDRKIEIMTPIWLAGYDQPVGGGGDRVGGGVPMSHHVHHHGSTSWWGRRTSAGRANPHLCSHLRPRVTANRISDLVILKQSTMTFHRSASLKLPASHRFRSASISATVPSVLNPRNRDSIR